MDLSKYHELKYYSSWSQCSYDNVSEECMVDNDGRVIAFDLVKTKFMNALGKSEECAASVDALGKDASGTVYFIEFKNGAIEKANIRNKITESLLLFHEITHTSSKDTRRDAEFILVYNPEKIHYNPQQKRAMELARLGDVPCPIIGLDKYYGTWVRKAYMMTAEKFKKKMVGIIAV